MWGKKNHENYEAIKEKAKEKKVTWNKNLLEIKNISPRVKKESFDFPSSNFTRKGLVIVHALENYGIPKK